MNDGDTFAFGIADVTRLNLFSRKNNFAFVGAMGDKYHTALSSALIYQTHFPPQSETISPAFNRKQTLSIAFTLPKVLVMFFISSR